MKEILIEHSNLSVHFVLFAISFLHLHGLPIKIEIMFEIEVGHGNSHLHGHEKVIAITKACISFLIPDCSNFVR